MNDKYKKDKRGAVDEEGKSAEGVEGKEHQEGDKEPRNALENT